MNRFETIQAAFDEPKPFREALLALQSRSVLPTNLTTAELRRMETELRRQSFYSAQTLFADLLESYKVKVQAIINPQRVRDARNATEENPDGWTTRGLDLATARLEIGQLLDELEYRPDSGKEGSIEDLASDSRIDLVLETNVKLMQGYGQWRQGQDPAIIDAFPAQELFRLGQRKVPREWAERWQEAGKASGETDGWGEFDGRLIALKNHAIWDKIGSSDLFDDALDNPWPPYAFNSGMWIVSVERDEAIALGLMAEGDDNPPVDDRTMEAYAPVGASENESREAVLA